jgi:glycosyltransferase involved in cell wall biosynthesis
VNEELVNSPTLSICLITFNQAQFIHKALDSILMQQVNFPIELIIADDCSTDGTEQILRDFERKHPVLTRLILKDKNVGPGQNWIDLLRAPRGIYAAYLEGDDYWTERLKLQKQVDFLQKNPEYSASFHNVQRVDIDGRPMGLVYDSGSMTDLTLIDLVKGKYMKSCSIVFKYDKKTIAPILDAVIPPRDISLGFCLLSNGSKAKYFEESMAAYRVHPGGVWSTRDFRYKFEIGYDHGRVHYKWFRDPAHKALWKKQLLYAIKSRSFLEFKEGKYLKALYYLAKLAFDKIFLR